VKALSTDRPVQQRGGGEILWGDGFEKDTSTAESKWGNLCIG
jgi:hypothetical protein